MTTDASRQIETHLLQLLLATPDSHVSGSDIAGALGISRVAVWARIQRLEHRGYRIAAIRNKGYRLIGEPATLDAPLVHARLGARSTPLAVRILETIDSTNTEATRLLSANEPAPLAVITRRQTQGRGRLGRQWHSPEEGNLMLSLGFRPNLPPSRLQLFTLWAGLRACLALREETGLAIHVKWPNDLYLDGRKLGGMLTEARMDADLVRDLVFGMGLNVNSNPSAWPGLGPIASSLKQVAGGSDFPINRILVRLLTALHDAYHDLVSRDIVPDLLADWPSVDLLAGRPVRTIPLASGDPVRQGTAAGITPHGALTIRDASGAIHTVNAGEVSIGTERLHHAPHHG